MADHKGFVRPGSTQYFYFDTFDGGTGASITMTGLATTDIEIYKDGSNTTRASDTGYALLGTDGIDEFGTGVHGFSIDLASDAAADFFTAGSHYTVVVASVTVDGQTVTFVAGSFTIGFPGAVLNTGITSITDQDTFIIDSGPAEADALNGCVVWIQDKASAVQGGFAVVTDYAVTTKTVQLLAGPTFTITAGDNISFFPPTNPQWAGGVAYTATRGLAGTALPAAAADGAGGLPISDAGGLDLDAMNTNINDIETDTNELQADWTNAGRLDTILDELTTNVDAIETDTQDLQTQIGAAGAGLTAVPWNAAWDAEVESEVNDGLVALGLDHLVGAAVIGTDVVDNSIVAKIVSASATADWDDFVNTTDALQAIRDRGDAAWTTGGGSGLTALASGTAQSGTASTIVLASAAAFADNELNGNVINIHTGTGAGQSRVIISNTLADDTCNVAPNWTTNPSSDSQYEIVQGSVNLEAISLDAAAAGNLELDYDGTGYAKANSTIGTTTTNTDMRGTDSAATAASLATAQADLDIITGATGVNLLAATQASIDAIETDTSTTLQGELDAIQAAVITNAAGADIAADIIAVKAETAAIVNDTDVIDDATSGLVKIAQDVAAILVDTGTTLPAEHAALNDISAANVNTEVVDVLKTDTLTATPQGAPPTTPTFEQAVMVIYDALVHAVDVTATSKTFKNNAGTVIWKKGLSDNGTTYTEAESASGP